MKISGTMRYHLNRGGWYLLTLIVATTLTFLLPRLGPVDTIKRILANINTSGMSIDEIATMEKQYRDMFHLDKSLPHQFMIYITQTLKGNLGHSSLRYPEKNWNLIKSKLPWSLGLIVPVVILSWIGGNLLGALAAYKRGIFDRILYPVSLFISSVPFFCFGLILVFIFFTTFSLVNSLGAYSMDIFPEWSWIFAIDVLHHYWLPFSSIFFIMLGGQAIGMRSLAIYELNSDYVTYAQAIGIKEKQILYYVFRNALLPQLSGLALTLGTMIGGTLITEIIFSYPGLGLMLLEAIQGQDYPLVQAIALVIAVTVLVLNFFVDVATGFIDPRIQSAYENGGTHE